jgi:hypothetical protein
MAYAFVQTSPQILGGGGNNTLTSPSMTFTAGNLIIVAIAVGNGVEQHVSTVTDTLGNTYQRATGSHIFASNVFSGTAVEIWYAMNVTGGATTVTVTWPSGGGFSIGYVTEWSGIATSSALVGVGTNSGTLAGASLTPNVTNAATSQPALYFAFIFANAASATATNITDRTGNLATAHGVVGDTRRTTTSPFTATVTFPATEFFVATSACFKETGGAPPPVAPSRVVIFFIQ